MLSMTTDYAKGTGDPSPALRRIAEAGFTHVHWCHQWNTDFLYSRWEVEAIDKWLREFGLDLLDLHGSHGVEKQWASPEEYRRLSGVELVQNRIDMTSRLGGEVVIMHFPGEGTYDALRRSLDALEGYAGERGVRLAIENGAFDAIGRILADYPPEYVGLCYDSGHGNMEAGGMDHLDRLKDRLISIHLHDNDGSGDQHNLVFSGTVDWARLAGILARSSYAKCVSMETTIHKTGIADETAFLATAFAAGTRFAEMVAAARRERRTVVV